MENKKPDKELERLTFEKALQIIDMDINFDKTIEEFSAKKIATLSNGEIIHCLKDYLNSKENDDYLLRLLIGEMAKRLPDDEED